MRKHLVYIILVFIFLNSCDDNADSVSPEINGKGGSLAQFTFIGDKLYVVTNDELITFKTRQRQPLVELDREFLRRGVETIFPKGNLLFLGTQFGMYIYETDQNGIPKYKSLTTHFFSCDPVVANDKHAFVTLNSVFGNCGRGVNELNFYDISNIENPKIINTIPMNAPRGLGLAGNLLFVCDGGLKVFDVSEPKSVRNPIDTYVVNDAVDVIPDGDHLYVIGEKALYQYKIEEDELKLLSQLDY